jgi:hypothetical protein
MCTSENYISAVEQCFFVAPFTLYRPKLTAPPNQKGDPRINRFPKNIRPFRSPPLWAPSSIKLGRTQKFIADNPDRVRIEEPSWQFDLISMDCFANHST